MSYESPYTGYGSSNQSYSNSLSGTASVLYEPPLLVAPIGPSDDKVTDNAVVRFDGTTGTVVQNSLAVLSDAGKMSLPKLQLTDLVEQTNDNILCVDALGNVYQMATPTAELTIGAFSATGNTAGLDLTSDVLKLCAATAAFPGGVSTATQTFAGEKIMQDDFHLQKDLYAIAGTSVFRRAGDGRTFLNNMPGDSIFLGTDAGNKTMTGLRNVGIGLNAGESLTTGNNNAAMGQNAGNLITSGSGNLCLGSDSGTAYTTESNNVTIENVGIAGDQNTIRLGNDSHTKIYCDAINANSIVGNQVTIDPATGELGYLTGAGTVSFANVGVVPNAAGASIASDVITLQPANGSNPGVLTAGAQVIGGAKSFAAAVSTDYTYDLASASSSAAGYINKGGSAWIHGGDSDLSQSIYVGALVGNFSPSFRNTCMGYDSLNLNSSATQTNAAYGWNSLKFLATGSGNVAYGSSSGRSLVTGDNNMYLGHNGNAVTVESNKIHIGNSSHDQVTCYGILPVGGTGTNIMTYNDGTQVVSASQNLPLPSTASASVGNINFNGVRFMHAYSSSGTKTNLFLGSNAGNYTNSGTNNIGMGVQALLGLTSGVGNVAIGGLAGAALSTGTSNTMIGPTAGQSLTTGGSNLFLGSQAGSSITTTNNNVIIANTGTVGDTNKILIGNTSHTGGTSIYGISGATSTGGVAVLVNASGVLGTTTSSIRFKDTITDIPHEKIDKLHQLRVVDFYYKDSDHTVKKNGMIAEEVLPIFPEMIAYEADGTTIQTIMYQEIWPLMLKEMQNLRAEVNQLKASNAVLSKLSALLGQ